VRIGLEIGAAVMAVHEAGLLHGRIDPAHVFLGPGNEARIDPFGLALRRRSANAGRHLGLQQVDADARAWAADVAWLHHERLRRIWMHDRTLQQSAVALEGAGL